MRVSEAVALLIQHKTERRFRPKYIKELNRVLIRFSQMSGNPMISDISPDSVERFIFSTDSPGGQQTTRARLSALFTFAHRRKILHENPLSRVAECSRPVSKIPDILSPSQCRQVMQFGLNSPRALAYLALCLFVGLRPWEAMRTSWEDIRFEDSTLMVHGKNSKTRRHRILELHPTAKLWLHEANARGSELPIRPQPIRRTLRRLRLHLSLCKWPQDVLRHTCASYTLSLSNDFAKTAWQLGNSEKILLRHYYRLAPKSDATEFWSIAPDDSRQLELFRS